MEWVGGSHLSAKHISQIILLNVFLGILVCAPAMAQTANEELAAIRESLNLAPTTPVTLADSSSVLPTDHPLKLYIATGLDMDVHGNFTKWIAEWNKKSGKKFGMIVTVTDVAQADVILLRYTLRNKITEKADTSSSVVSGTVYDWSTHSWITRPVTSTSSDSESFVPEYMYVIAREAKGFQILSRHAGEAPLGEAKDSGKVLRDDFFDMMRTDAKKAKDQAKHR